jgi:UDP-3-O-[3-hydroxymyristoyl] glucosamine N-acyltransferase
MKLQQIADHLHCILTGNSDIEITGVAGIEHATVTQLTFLANMKYAPKVQASQAGAIIAAEPIPGRNTLISTNPYYDHSRALALFYQPPRPKPGIHPTAAIAPSAQIGEGASIGAYCVIGEHVRLGRNALLHPHVVIYDGATIGDDFTAHSHATIREHCQIGHRVILQNSVVIGGDGFGFAKTAQGTHAKIVQSGITVLEDDVEIQTLTSIDRACVVGEDNIICAQTGLAGTTILERNVLLAGQVGISGHLTIHENSVVYAQSGVGHDVPAGSAISGSPAFDAKVWLRAIMAFQKLPELLRTVRQLERSQSKSNSAPSAD